MNALMLQKGLPCAAEISANSAQEFEALISTIRTASIRGFGGSTPNRLGAAPDGCHLSADGAIRHLVDFALAPKSKNRSGNR